MAFTYYLPDETGNKVEHGTSSNSLVIIGANGSGKSNFINALLFMCNLVQTSISYQPGQKILQARHKLSEKEKPSTFDIQFIRKNVRYAYGFSIEGGAITEEYLYYFPLFQK